MIGTRVDADVAFLCALSFLLTSCLAMASEPPTYTDDQGPGLDTMDNECSSIDQSVNPDCTNCDSQAPFKHPRYVWSGWITCNASFEQECDVPKGVTSVEFTCPTGSAIQIFHRKCDCGGSTQAQHLYYASKACDVVIPVVSCDPGWTDNSQQPPVVHPDACSETTDEWSYTVHRGYCTVAGGC